MEDLEIQVRLLSNWGHSSRIGLTEIQLLESSGQRIEVDPANVTLHGAEDSSDVGCLFNGKCKVRVTHHSSSWKFDVILLIKNKVRPCG